MAKEVLVIRHAEKTKRKGTSTEPLQLTDEGRRKAQQLGEQLGDFHTIITTSRLSGRATAEEMTGKQPIIDERAGFMEITEAQKEDLKSEDHPMGIAGAVFENSEYRELARMSGLLLVVLIKEVLRELPEDEKALIVSHNVPMMGAEQQLQHLDSIGKGFGFLEGFKVNEQLEIERLDESLASRSD